MTVLIRRKSGSDPWETVEDTGGGASFPDEWTVGTDGSLAIDTLSTDPYALKLRRNGVEFAAFGGSGRLADIEDPDSTASWKFNTDGTSEFSGPQGTVLTMNGDGSMWFGIVQNIVCTAGGFFAIEFNGPPSDSEVPSSSMILWFDRTNGAAKLMVKAKQDDGTVVTGSIPLAP